MFLSLIKNGNLRGADVLDMRRLDGIIVPLVVQPEQNLGLI